MTDLANLVLAVDSTSVPKATASLDGLAAAGARAEAATVGLGGGFKGVGAGATAMAVAAQASARAAMDQAAGFKASTNAAHLNTLAMRETLVVARELSRGNFTRLPGSLTLLAQGVGSQGGFGAYASALANTLGLVKKVQNAELAEQAVSAASAAAAVQGAAERAAANVVAADTEIALAEAQLRVTAGTSAESAAQARLAAAHEAVAGAAAEAAIAENALGAAMGRSMEAGAASAAATSTTLGAVGAALAVIAPIAITLGIALEGVKHQAEDIDPAAKQLISTLGLTHREIERLKDTTVSWGDIAHSTFDVIAGAAGTSGSEIASAFGSAFRQVAEFAKFSASIVLGAFAGAVQGVHSLLGSLPQIGVGLVTGNYGLVGQAFKGAGQDALGQFKKSFNDVEGGFDKIAIGANARRDARVRSEAAKIIGDRAPKRDRKAREPSDHGAQESVDKLQADIKGQYALAAAYQVSDAAAMKAAAAQKAEEDAIQHKSQVGRFYELELQKAVATRAAEGGKIIGDLHAQTAAQSTVNAMVAAGIIPASQMSEQLQLEAKLRPLIAAYDLADAAHKRLLADEIKNLTNSQKDYNASVAQGQALQQVAANDNEIAQLKLKNQLLGASNQEIATAMAHLQAMQYLADHPGIDASTAAQLTAGYVQKAQLAVQSPFQQWAATVPQTAAAINDALQSIEFKGFDSLGSAISDVVTGTKTLGAAFKDIANSIISDIIQMTVKMLIFKAITGIFGGGVGGGAGSGGSLFTGARASGGPVSGGQTYLVGEKGPELFRPSNSGSIVPNNQLAANNNSSGPIEVHLIVEASEDLAVKSAHVANQVVSARKNEIVGEAAKVTVQVLTRKTLNGG